MARRTGLRTRLARLESRRAERHIPRVVFTVYDRSDADILGAIGGATANITILRQPGETQAELCERAFATAGGQSIALLYARPSAASEQNEAQATQTAVNAQNASDGLPSDPYALAGIGRRATRAELERSGLFRVPPERLID